MFTDAVSAKLRWYCVIVLLYLLLSYCGVIGSS